MLYPNETATVKNRYDSETCDRTIVDEYSGRVCRVVHHKPTDFVDCVMCDTGEEVEFHCQRLQLTHQPK